MVFIPLMRNVCGWEGQIGRLVYRVYEPSGWLYNRNRAAYRKANPDTWNAGRAWLFWWPITFSIAPKED